MLKDLYKLLDLLELVNVKNYFDEIAKEIQLQNAIKLLKIIIRDLNKENT